jgi:hypothetical protein
MMWQTPKAIGLIALFVAVIVSGVGIVMPADTAYTDDCLAAPNSPAPQGNHWYFRIDRAKNASAGTFVCLAIQGNKHKRRLRRRLDCNRSNRSLH